MATRIDVNVFCEYLLTTLNMAFTKTSSQIPYTLLEKQGNANDASNSLLQISIMLVNVFCNSFSRSSLCFGRHYNKKIPFKIIENRAGSRRLKFVHINS